MFANERGERIELGWAELGRQVASVAAGLRLLGVGRGDRVAGFVANRPETVVAMLATASMGARLVVVLAGFRRRTPCSIASARSSRKCCSRPTATSTTARASIRCRSCATIAERLRDLRAVVVIPYRVGDPRSALAAARHAVRATSPTARREPHFEAVPFDHPLYILYSSGTTGVPKCIVHGVGGTLLQHRKEHVLHTDIRAGDVVFYFTTTGWMMWNWLVSALASGATIVLYDGAPLHPDPGVLWRLAERERINVFGTSARYLSALEKSGYVPNAAFRLARAAHRAVDGLAARAVELRLRLSQRKADLQLSSIAGGTDLISCFALGNPLLPVYRGELQCRGLGMKVEIFDPHGRAAARRERRARLHGAVPIDADRLLERSGRRASTARRTSIASRTSGATATTPSSRRTAAS